MSLERDVKVGLVNSEAVNVIVCNTCHVVVAEDIGRTIDVAIIANQTRSHLSTPLVSATVDMQTKTSQAGLHFEKNFTN